MTKPPTETTESGREDLLKKLEGTSPSTLRNSVAKVEGITKDDEENHSRWLKSVRRKVTNKLTSWFLHFLFCVTCLIVLAAVIGTIWLSYVWISSFINDAVKVGSLLARFWEIGLVALATLFIQNSWPKD